MLIHNIGGDGNRGRKLCLVHGDIAYTYQEFTAKVDSLAYHLAVQVKKGDKVLLKLSDPVAQLSYFFAIVKAGGICVFADAVATAEFCSALVNQHAITICIADNFQPPAAAAASLPDISRHDVFLGAVSSGSTGTPKVIWRDHSSWTEAFGAQSEVFGISGEDTLFLAGSLAYTANLNACMHMLALGGTVVIAANSRPRTWLQEMTAYQVSAVFLVPANYRILLKTMQAPLPQVKSVVSGGAAMDVATVRQLAERFPQAGIFVYYGASELGHVSYMTAADFAVKPDSAGKPFPGVKVWIEDGTVWAESPYLAPAYKPWATAGDLGRLDADGYLYLLGRMQTVINSGGVKVIPEQVEAVLRQCPGVAQAAVCGVADELKGQRVCAWVVKSDPSLTQAAVLAFCRSRMHRSHCPQQVIFVAKLPLNPAGKVDRPGLVASYQLSKTKRK